MQAPTIDICNVSLDFEGKPLFSDLTMTIEPGICTCILGPSGCGKSTLLRLIGGAKDYAHSGKITFSPSSDPEQCCAWMSQDDLLLPWLSLKSNVLLGARLRNEVTKDAELRASELIHNSGLAEYEHALPATLSGGMRQRTALLRTLMESRPVLLMDEPFSALDALTRVRLQNLSSELTQGATVILVTHDPLEALRMADRIIVFTNCPVEIKAEMTFETPPPRSADDPDLVERYGMLLKELMEEVKS